MLLDFDEPPRAVNRKRFVAIGFLVLSAFGLIGQTLASNVNLGSGAPLEFGQGIQRLVSCSPEAPIFLTPNNNFKNAPGNAALFQYSGISFAGIQNSCVGFDFVIRAYGLTGGPLPLFGGNKTEVRVYQSNGDVFSKSVNDSFTISNQVFGAFTVTFDTPVTPSADVYRITLETFPHDSTMIRYRIGDTGPAGGTIVLLPTSQGNTSNEYFEVKSINFSEIWCDAWPFDIPDATGSAIGDGEANTNAIMRECNDSAAYNATAYPGSPNDWFLPSRDELVAALNTSFVPLFGGNLWTSTQFDSDAAYTVSYPSGTIGTYIKIGSLPAVAMRSFP